MAQGKFRRVVDENGKHIGYQPIVAEPQRTPPSDASRAALGVAETRANAGLMGRSRTAHLSEEQRSTRIHPKSGRLLPQEDFVERTHKLMEIYPQFANRGGDRAVRVYPKVPAKAR